MHQTLSHAVKWSLITTNPVASADPPAVQPTEIEILVADELKSLLKGLKECSLYPVAVLGLATGMRRGEMVALRWKNVDLDGGKIRVEQSLEQTNAGLRFKLPKTKAGRRTVTVPPSIVSELRAHWRSQQEQRLALGLGKASGDDLVLARHDGSAWPPDSLSSEWARTLRVLKLPKITLHALRHTHVSQLIASGLDVVTVSRRIGHSNPSITLNVYSHLFGNTDEKAAAAVDAALSSALGE
jgi:integrase